MTITLKDFGELVTKAAQLENQVADLLRNSIGAVRDGATPRAPREPEPGPPAPAPAPEPGPPHYGFQNPAPPNAPKLEPENISPQEARKRLQDYIACVRRFGDHMQNVGKLSHALADLLERGATDAVHGLRRDPPRYPGAEDRRPPGDPARRSKRW